MILLPQPPKWWNYSCVLPHSALFIFFPSLPSPPSHELSSSYDYPVFLTFSLSLYHCLIMHPLLHGKLLSNIAFTQLWKW
jgi:hypothetical protein